LKFSACFVYVLGTIGSDDKRKTRTYVGWTNDLDMRITKHNNGTGAKSTRGWQWELLYAEKYLLRGDAMSREWYLKRDRKFKRELLRNWVI